MTDDESRLPGGPSAPRPISEHRWGELLIALRAALADGALQPAQVGAIVVRRVVEVVKGTATATVLDPMSSRVEFLASAGSTPEIEALLADSMAHFRVTPPDWRPIIEAVRAGAMRQTREDIRAGWPADAPFNPAISEVLVLPLRYEGDLIGVMTVGRYDDVATSEADQAHLADVADAAGLALGAALVVEELRRSERVTRAMAGNVGLTQLFGGLLPTLRDTVGAEAAAVFVPHGAGELVVAASVGLELDDSEEEVALVGPGDVRNPFSGRIVARGRPVSIDDVSAVPGLAPAETALGATIAGVPVDAGSGTVGVLAVGSALPRRFTTADLELLTVIASRLSVGIQQAAAERAARERDERAKRVTEDLLRHQAMHDGLTGLPNRTLFGEHLDRGLANRARHRRAVAVMFLDLDRFKDVNDSLGHAAGDQLLIQVAERLRRAVRPGDLVARLGGDEFAVLLDDVAAPAGPVTVAHRILHQFADPVDIDGQAVAAGVSIGIAYTASDSREDGSDLLRNADAALYLAKERGGNRFEIFDEPMRSWLRRRLQLEGELQSALEAGEVEVHYQPTLDLRDGHVHRVEALARWHHPERGLLPAVEFIAVAQDSGLIVPLGLTVIRHVARQRAQWATELASPPPLVAVNLSGRELSQGSLDDLLSVVAPLGAALSVEIPESTLVSDFARVERHVRALKERGVRVTLDEYGTAYTGPSQLRRLPIDSLKIDREFVGRVATHEDDRVIVHAIIELGHALGLTVAAGGIGDDRQLAILTELGCDEVQGHLISPALAPAEMLAFLAAEAQGA